VTTVPYRRLAVPTADQWAIPAETPKSGNICVHLQTPLQTDKSIALVAPAPHDLVAHVTTNKMASSFTASVASRPANSLANRVALSVFAIALLVACAYAFADENTTGPAFESTPVNEYSAMPVQTNFALPENLQRPAKAFRAIAQVSARTSRPASASAPAVPFPATKIGGTSPLAEPKEMDFGRAVAPSIQDRIKELAPPKAQPASTSAERIGTLAPDHAVAVLAAGVVFSGLAAFAGNAIANRRRLRPARKAQTSVLVTQHIPEIATETIPADAPSAIPDESTFVTSTSSITKQEGVGGAAIQAYIDPHAWMEALACAYGVDTQPSPCHAVVSIAGARDGNEDYACRFVLRDPQTGSDSHCMVVGDGCGGHAGGRVASCIAVRAASETLASNSGTSSEEAVRLAFRAAIQAMITAGRRWDPNALRTTLIVVVADPNHYALGWIGDGGIDLHRASGRWERLLKPHKSGEAQNLLAASLGPDLVGEPSFAVHPREPGDRIYVGTDGVCEVYNDPAAYWEAWFEDAARNRSPQACLSDLLSKCAEHAAFDDNLTVAYLHTPVKSALGPTNIARTGTLPLAPSPVLAA
jgi:serine/threonine protein phosphatase PrpC